MARRYQYDTLIEPITPGGQEAEAVHFDALQPITNLPQANWKQKALNVGFIVAMAPALAFTNIFPANTETVTLDKWYQENFLPPKGAVHKEYQYPSFFIDSKLMTQSENITLDKWFIALSEPRRDVKRQQYTYPTLSWYPKITLPPMVISGSNVHVVFRERRQYQAVTKPLILFAETITMDKWNGYRPVYIWAVKRLQYLYPPWAAIDTKFYTAPTLTSIWTKEPEGTASWTKGVKDSATWTKDVKPPNLV